MADNQAGFYIETGTTGVPMFWGQFKDRYLEILQGPSGIDRMAKVLRKEPAAFTLNNAIHLTARQATPRVVGASDKPADRRAAEFLESCLDDMSKDFDEATSFALSGSAFGFSDLAVVFKRRLGRSPTGDLPPSKYDDGRVGLRKLAIRRQETIYRWEKDEHGDPKAMIQSDPETGAEYPAVPIGRLLHFTFGDDRGGWEGLGWLEPAYKLAQYIERLEILYGIGQQRSHVGLPVFAYENKPSAQTQAIVERIARNLIVNEQQFVSYPKNEVDFRLESINNQNAGEAREMIGQLRWEIMALMFGQFLRLGNTQSGSRALADPLVMQFLSGVDGALQTVASVMNRHLFTRLMAFNPALAAGLTDYPRLTFASAKPLPTEVLQYLDSIGRFLATSDPEDNKWLRTVVGMPQVTVVARPGGDGAGEEGQRTQGEGGGANNNDAGDEGQQTQEEDDNDGGQQAQEEDGEEQAVAADRLSVAAVEFNRAAQILTHLVEQNGAVAH